MALSDIRGEDALDVLADLIEPAASIMADKDVRDAYRSGDKIGAIKAAIKGHKKDVIKVMAICDGADPDDEKYLNTITVLSLPVKLMALLNDQEVQMVFQSQSPKMPSESSGSAMENTKEEEQ